MIGQVGYERSHRTRNNFAPYRVIRFSQLIPKRNEFSLSDGTKSQTHSAVVRVETQ